MTKEERKGLGEGECWMREFFKLGRVKEGRKVTGWAVLTKRSSYLAQALSSDLAFLSTDSQRFARADGSFGK